jgi:hypothetical protein
MRLELGKLKSWLQIGSKRRVYLQEHGASCAKNDLKSSKGLSSQGENYGLWRKGELRLWVADICGFYV